jgi:hypothetical protein
LHPRRLRPWFRMVRCRVLSKAHRSRDTCPIPTRITLLIDLAIEHCDLCSDVAHLGVAVISSLRRRSACGISGRRRKVSGRSGRSPVPPDRPACSCALSRDPRQGTNMVTDPVKNIVTSPAHLWDHSLGQGSLLRWPVYTIQASCGWRSSAASRRRPAARQDRDAFLISIARRGQQPRYARAACS